jgi:hypothetical protein
MGGAGCDWMDRGAGWYPVGSDHMVEKIGDEERF